MNSDLYHFCAMYINNQTGIFNNLDVHRVSQISKYFLIRFESIIAKIYILHILEAKSKSSHRFWTAIFEVAQFLPDQWLRIDTLVFWYYFVSISLKRRIIQILYSSNDNNRLVSFCFISSTTISMHKHVNCFSSTAHGYFLFQ